MSDAMLDLSNAVQEKPGKGGSAPYAAGTGAVPVGMDRASFERMSYRERVAFKREDPEGYRAMKDSM